MIRLGLTPVDQAWDYSASSDAHTDETTDINDAGTGDANVFSSTCVNVGDIFYFAHTYNRFGRVSGSISTVSAACPVTVWEYYNSVQATWVTVPELDSEFAWKTAGSQDLQISASTYDLWRDYWGKTSVCGISAYYLRARVSSVTGAGSGATFTSASVDLTLPNPIPKFQLMQHGRIHQLMDGSRVQDINATKRRISLQWPILDKDDATSIRERVAFTQSASLNFDSGWGEDNAQIVTITDMLGYDDTYLPPAHHTIILELLEA